MDIDIDKLIKDAYYNPDTGYVGAQKLYEKLKKEGVTLPQVKRFLKNQEVVQLTKKNHQNTSFVPQKPLQEFQIDLIYIENKQLNANSYGLVCIDVFTKIADVELMKKKTAKDTVKAMEEILKRMGIPQSIYCDEGSEFIAKEFQDLAKKNNINVIYTLTHAPFVERFNRTLKEMLSKYMLASESKTMTKVLPRIIRNYNDSYHSALLE